jgi:hypothetical protein
VDALQASLVPLTGLRASEQILMCGGRPLEAAQPLSAYQLPQVCAINRLCRLTASCMMQSAQI